MPLLYYFNFSVGRVRILGVDHTARFVRAFVPEVAAALHAESVDAEFWSKM